ncbi:Aste57867_15386 [Aphanomyces stellatus]|uniref:Aste57867_15386 protein n=1 Tax=Aphanomyces stellatus TaxID=120398 RepID=A0A485L312_9STRA|nr:hypothetical protein As57867_015330 [Aphanomyces stellatus]VFT92192.1 Aste57867_15386 [Aphanomyces stellatus]
MATPSSPYAITRSLEGHGGAIRAICDVNGTLVTGAMDAAVICWDPSSAPLQSIFEHSHWVTALVALDTAHESLFSSVGFATGGMDTHVRVFTKEEASGSEFVCVVVLQGHTSGVISLGWTTPTAATASSLLLSGSWDGTCRGWDLQAQSCRFVLPNHENGVCVLGLPDGRIATGSTGRQQGNQVVDACIRLWTASSSSSSEFAVTKTLTDHQGPSPSPDSLLLDVFPSSRLSLSRYPGPVRQLVQVDGFGFASCSNDGTIKLRAADDGAVLMSASHPLNHEGKPGFVLGLTYLAGPQHLVSASEDCTARVWALGASSSHGTCVQTIDHPSGLWCVAALANGTDFATGAEDKSTRVFSSVAGAGDPSLAAALAAQVAEAQIQKSRGPSAVEIEKLPAYEQRGSMVGKSDGMIQMFRRDNVAWACQWNSPSATWVDIGQVTGTGSGGVIDGQAYDMVIPVELETPSGLRKLEIGYNQGQNPFSVAQAFIDKHFLNPSYLKEIADYISDRSANYQPPLLGDHSGGGASATSSVTSTPATATPPPASAFFPPRAFASFDSTKIAKLHATVVQFNDAIEVRRLSSGCVNHPTFQPTALTPVELDHLATLIQTLQQTSYYHSSSVSRVQVHTALKLLDQWPPAKVFPALDLIRLVLVHPMGASLLASAPSLVPTTLRLALAPDATDATRFLAVRVLCNMFGHAATRVPVLAAAEAITSAVAPWVATTPSKPLAISVATLLLNLAVALHQGLVVACAPSTVASLLAAMVTWTDEDALGRVLVALATLATTTPALGIELPPLSSLQTRVAAFPSTSPLHAIVQDMAKL